MSLLGHSSVSRVISKNLISAPLFASPTAKRHLWGIFWINFGEREIRSGGGLGAFSIFINHNSSDWSASWWGKSEAVCPSGPIPKKAISIVPTRCEYSTPSLSICGRRKYSSRENPHAHNWLRNSSQICSSLRSFFSQCTRSSVTHHRILSVSSSCQEESWSNSAYHASNDVPPQRPTITVSCTSRSSERWVKNHSVTSEYESVIFIKTSSYVLPKNQEPKNSSSSYPFTTTSLLQGWYICNIGQLLVQCRRSLTTCQPARTLSHRTKYEGSRESALSMRTS